MSKKLDEDERRDILEAIRILDVKKAEVVDENLAAWFVLYRAKYYLKGLLNT